MSTLYVINLFSNSNGHHTVHKYGCPLFPDNYFELGLYETCTDAVKSAKDIHADAKCCPKCIAGCKDSEHLDKPISKDISFSN